MVVVLGLVYMLLFVIACVVFACGLESSNKHITIFGLVLVVLWGCWAIIH